MWQDRDQREQAAPIRAKLPKLISARQHTFRQVPGIPWRSSGDLPAFQRAQDLPLRCPHGNVLFNQDLIRTLRAVRPTTGDRSDVGNPDIFAADRRGRMAQLFASFEALSAFGRALRHSPIAVTPVHNCRSTGQLGTAEWARIRNSPNIDGFILEWLADHAHAARHRGRNFNLPV